MDPGPTHRTTGRLRSALYMPGANERALVKAREIPADALILDLEDAVAPAAKRGSAGARLRGGGLRGVRESHRGDPRQRSRHRVAS